MDGGCVSTCGLVAAFTRAAAALFVVAWLLHMQACTRAQTHARSQHTHIHTHTHTHTHTHIHAQGHQGAGAAAAAEPPLALTATSALSVTTAPPSNLSNK
eukprot:1160539-Pelagomonas_calceolata.AAC.5